MVDLRGRPNLGPYRLVGRLAPSRGATRWLALHEHDHTTHVVHEFAPCHDKAEQRRFIAAVEGAATLRHAHILEIEQFSFFGLGRACVVTPYTGNQDGLVTLDDLARAKGGRMAATEVERALTQILEACQYAHDLRQAHGEIDAPDALIDRSGSVYIEMYGMARRLRGGRASHHQTVADEVRSLVALGYRLVSGLPAEEPRIPAGRLIKKLDRRWDEWFDAGLHPVDGFATAREAIDALPSSRRATEDASRAGRVRGMISLFRSAIGAP